MAYEFHSLKFACRTTCYRFHIVYKGAILSERSNVKDIVTETQLQLVIEMSKVQENIMATK